MHVLLFEYLCMALLVIYLRVLQATVLSYIPNSDSWISHSS